MAKTSGFVEKIRSRQPVLGVWMQIPHPMVAETLAQSQFDFILLDGEHAPVPPDCLVNLLPAMELHGMPVLYRVRWNTVELIKAALDHGVSGLMVPTVNSLGEAQFAVSAARYAPLGRRGFGPWRASNYYLDEPAYIAAANANTPLILQIESKEAVAAVDEIAALPGIDGLYVGPGDLALSLGLPLGKPHPQLLEAFAKVSEAARRNGIAAGIDVASLDYVPTYRKLGFSLLTHGLDTSFLIDGSRAIQRKLREAAKG